MEQKYQSLGLVAGANLKRLIKQSSYKTQEEFAYEFGTDVRTVGRWINHGIDRICFRHPLFMIGCRFLFIV